MLALDSADRPSALQLLRTAKDTINIDFPDFPPGRIDFLDACAPPEPVPGWGPSDPGEPSPLPQLTAAEQVLDEMKDVF